MSDIFGAETFFIFNDYDVSRDAGPAEPKKILKLGSAHVSDPQPYDLWRRAFDHHPIKKVGIFCQNYEILLPRHTPQLAIAQPSPQAARMHRFAASSGDRRRQILVNQ
jgi:hypothetical protein